MTAGRAAGKLRILPRENLVERGERFIQQSRLRLLLALCMISRIQLTATDSPLDASGSCREEEEGARMEKFCSQWVRSSGDLPRTRPTIRNTIPNRDLGFSNTRG